MDSQSIGRIGKSFFIIHVDFLVQLKQLSSVGISFRYRTTQGSFQKVSVTADAIDQLVKGSGKRLCALKGLTRIGVGQQRNGCTFIRQWFITSFHLKSMSRSIGICMAGQGVERKSSVGGRGRYSHLDGNTRRCFNEESLNYYEKRKKRPEICTQGKA
jgi:hypothetical protein